MTPLRVAVVGAGGWGDQHARVFSNRADAELVGIWSRRAERAAERAARWGTEGFSDLDTMIERTRPDLISVCLPNTRHHAITRQLIDHGIPLLVEKPLVFELAEGRDLIDAAAARGLFTAINFNHRYAEPVRRARAAIEAGELGSIGFASWRFGGEGGSDHHPWANLIETQCHGIDLLQHLAGPIAAVSAEATEGPGGERDTLAVALRFASGAVGSLVGSYRSSYAYPDTQLVEVNGDAGRVLVHDTVRRFELSRAGDAERRVWEAGYFDDRARDFEQTFDRHVDAIVAALVAGDPPPVPAAVGLQVLQVCHAIIASVELGRRVSVS